MARVTPKVAAAILVTTVVVSAGVGFAWSRMNGADDSVVAEQAGVYDEPGSIATAPKLDGELLPDATIEDLDGNEHSARDLFGKPMVINVWASTCEPCKKELPEFAAVHTELGDQVRFIGLDYFDGAELAQQFAEEHGVQYELYLDNRQEFISELEIAVFPTTLLVSADGRILKQHIGALTGDELRATINETLLP